MEAFRCNLLALVPVQYSMCLEARFILSSIACLIPFSEGHQTRRFEHCVRVYAHFSSPVVWQHLPLCLYELQCPVRLQYLPEWYGSSRYRHATGTSLSLPHWRGRLLRFSASVGAVPHSTG